MYGGRGNSGELAGGAPNAEIRTIGKRGICIALHYVGGIVQIFFAEVWALNHNAVFQRAPPCKLHHGMIVCSLCSVEHSRQIGFVQLHAAFEQFRICGQFVAFQDVALRNLLAEIINGGFDRFVSCKNFRVRLCLYWCKFFSIDGGRVIAVPLAFKGCGFFPSRGNRGAATGNGVFTTPLRSATNRCRSHAFTSCGLARKNRVRP